jgi:hypothetical protein
MEPDHLAICATNDHLGGVTEGSAAVNAQADQWSESQLRGNCSYFAVCLTTVTAQGA